MVLLQLKIVVPPLPTDPGLFPVYIIHPLMLTYTGHFPHEHTLGASCRVSKVCIGYLSHCGCPWTSWADLGEISPVDHGSPVCWSQEIHQQELCPFVLSNILT